MSLDSPSIAVCYLLWSKLDLSHFKAFLDSYKKHPASQKHSLFILFNGFQEDDDRPALSLLEGVEFQRRDFRDDGGCDIGPYLEIATSEQYDYFCFLNSYSRILGDNWLNHFYSAYHAAENCRLIGASGVWESNAGDLPFPNYSVRTNAFFIAKTTFEFLDLWEMTQKSDTNEFESGPNGLSQQIMRNGFEVYVVDKFGKYWPRTAWDMSLTFRSGDQENLLIADNRTEHYQHGDVWTRTFLSNLAWREGDPGPNPFKRNKLSRRIRRAFRWLGIKQK